MIWSTVVVIYCFSSSLTKEFSDNLSRTTQVDAVCLHSLRHLEITKPGRKHNAVNMGRVKQKENIYRVMTNA